ncbi:MAG: PKD domain-containing protein [Bacteroidetes bacterium]|nr:PKD domain-containing protein [Bacteroidota bacterium]
MKKVLIAIILLFKMSNLYSQDLSNKGKEFWIPYPEHIDGTQSAMGIYITSDVTTSGSIQVGATNIPFTITANTVVRKFLGPNAAGDAPNTGVHMTGIQDGIGTGKGIKVTALKPVVVFAHIIRSARSGATLVLPTKVWGKDYVMPSFGNTGTSQSFGEMNIIASKPNTQIEITPTANTRNGAHVAGTPFTVTIPNVGDVYQLQFQQNADPSGTRIRSLASGGSGCVPIAVFSATTWSGFSCTNASGGDNLYQQLFPTSAWGKEFFTGPLKKVATNAADNNTDFIRVYVSDPTTVVTKTDNGVATILTGLTAGNYYQYTAFRPTRIQSDKPVQVVQYVSSQTCGTPQTNSDPEMVVLSSTEQTINNITVFSAHQAFVPTGQSQVTTHYVNIIMKTINTGSLRINGVAPTAVFTPIPGTVYSYLKEDLTARAATNPVFNIRADSGFSAIAYGFGNVESYGYNAGTNVKDLYQQIGVNTEYGIEPTPSVCKGSPFKFKVSLPYCADSIRWDLTQLPAPLPSPTSVLMQYTTCVPGPGGPDSTTVVNGKTLYWYSLPYTYNFLVSGTFPVLITTYAPNADGCGNEQEIEFDLNVYDPPLADFLFTVGGCVAEPVQFTDHTETPRPNYRWNWDFGDPASGAANTSNVQNPTHTFSAPGTYTVTFWSITTPGCVSATITKQVTIAPLPTASITGTIDVCQNGIAPTITFTATDGTAPYTFTYNINGGASQSISTVTGNTATITVPTGTPGTFIYNLESVKNTGSTLCAQPQTGSATVKVNPLPTASLVGTTTVCKNAPSPTITFTGAVGTAPYTFDYNINGGATQSVTTTVGNSVTVSVPTGTAGTFTYNLESVKDASSTTCTQAQTGAATVIVNELPTASIAGTIEVCKDAPSPLITFTGAGTSAPYTFTYNINGGANQTITTTVGNTVTVSVPTATTGTFNYNLVSVSDGTAQVCAQAQTGIATVIVDPLPTASIAGNTAVCVNAPSPNITFTGATGVPPYTFNYTINAGPTQSVTTVAGNSVTVAVPTTTAGTFTYSLQSVQNAGPVPCTQAQTGNVVVTVNPLPTAAITGNITVCKNAPAPNVTFTGGAATAPYTFTYNINGGANQTITTTVGNSVTVAAPTGTPGTYVYNLVSVQDASSTLCSQNQTGAVTVTVNELPTASIAGTTEVCLNALSPTVTFTGAGTSAPYTFTYNINGGPTQSVTTVAGNSVTVNVPTGTAGTFTYNLLSVQDATAQLCNQAQTGAAVVTVHPLPTPDFSVTAPTCETKVLNFTDLSTPNVGTTNAWTWNFGDLSPVDNTQNPTHTYAAAGNYAVTLTVTNSKGCVSNPALVRNITVNKQPVADATLPEVCLDDTFAQFFDNSSVTPGTITNWLWNFGDPGSGPLNTSTLQNPQHSYSSTGNYTVSLTVTTNNGCVTTQTFPFTVNGDIPVADFTPLNPATMCANDSISIRDASTVNFGSVTKVEIYWDNVGAPGTFDTDDTPTPGKIYKHKYPNFQSPLTRTFTIRYRAYSGGTCVNDRLRTITVNAAPLVQFNAMPNACLDAAPFQITQASEIGGVPGSGVFSGPGVNAAGIFNPALVGPGTYPIKYTFTSTAGGCVDTLTRNITVLDSASARFTFSATACEKSAVSFNSTTSTIPLASGTITGWTWNFGDPASGANNTSTLQNPTHIFTGWGNYTVTLSVTTSNGCRSTTRTQTVFVNPIPRPRFTVDPSVCLPSATVVFTNVSTIPDGTEPTFTYLWNFGDPGSGPLNTSTNSGPSHIYTNVGPYTVNLQVTSGAGCVRDTNIVINNIHPEPFGSFTADKTDICVGAGSFTFTDNSDPRDGTTVQWNWNMDDGNIRTTPVVNYTFTTPRTYNVSLYTVNSFGCRSTTYTMPITVHPYPVVDAGPDRIMLEGGQIMLEPVVTGNELSYLWTPALPGYFAGSNAIKNPNVNGVDDITLTLTVTARGGCKASDQMFIKVLKAPAIPNIFSPNGDGVHDTWVIAYLNTYPGSTVDIYNRYGQLIFHSDGYNVPWDGTIKGKPVPIGTYYYIVNPKNGRKVMTGYVDVIR